MLDILALIRPAKTDAAGLRTKVAQIDEHMVGLNGLVRHAERKRSEALLTKSDREVEALEKDLALAIRNRDRAIAAREHMEKQAAEAEEAERRKVIDDDIARVNARADAIAAKLRKRYEPVATELVEMLTELQAAEAEIQRIRWLLVDAKRGGETPASAEERAFGLGPLVNLDQAGLPAITSLRPAGKCPGWGPAAQIAATFSMKS